MGPLPAPSAPDLPPAGRLWDLVTVHAVARCLHTVAEFGVADAIGDSPLPVSVIASRSGLHPDALHRMLRLLAAHGVFAQATDGYAHTEASALLRTDHPQSMRAFARMMGMPIA
jgi:DNA-binding IclR family transcriptional regulator